MTALPHHDVVTLDEEIDHTVLPPEGPLDNVVIVIRYITDNVSKYLSIRSICRIESVVIALYAPTTIVLPETATEYP